MPRSPKSTTIAYESNSTRRKEHETSCHRISYPPINRNPITKKSHHPSTFTFNLGLEEETEHVSTFPYASADKSEPARIFSLNGYREYFSTHIHNDEVKNPS